jgi:hypothetical protein
MDSSRGYFTGSRKKPEGVLSIEAVIPNLKTIAAEFRKVLEKPAVQSEKNDETSPGFTALPLDPRIAAWAVRLFHRFLP